MRRENNKDIQFQLQSHKHIKSDIKLNMKIEGIKKWDRFLIYL
jgi:hypothetical protein